MAASAPVPTLADAVSSGRPRGRRLLGHITPSSRWYWLRLLVANRISFASLAVIVVVALVGLLAPLLTPYGPTFLNPVIRLQPPSADHWFGTDDLGRDVLSRVIAGTRISLGIGVAVTVVAALIGSALGLVSGYYDRLDSILMRIMDGLMAFPSILLAIALMASLGPSVINVFLALVVVYTPSIARLIRSQTLVLRHMTYVESARSVGLTDGAILRRYVFGNAISPLIVQATFVIAYAIISEASLSFLGAGVPPEDPTWGNMLREGQRVLQRAWWLAVFPGVALVVTILTLNLVGDALRDALDPRARGRG